MAKTTIPFLLVWLLASAVFAQAPVRVFAAASLTPALEDIADQWQGQGHARPVLVFGASSMLARQIQAGAPADVYASADSAWMDWLSERGRIRTDTRHDLLGNDLVLIAPKGADMQVRMAPQFDLAGSFQGRLCTGEPGVVPVGRYAEAALRQLGWWQALHGRIVGTADVRAALAFVERGECALGIVYASDAQGSVRVRVLAQFPADSHGEIVYPFALVEGGNDAAAEVFLHHLRGDEASAVFQRHGFRVRTRVAMNP